jgi:hypothetical protein
MDGDMRRRNQHLYDSDAEKYSVFLQHRYAGVGVTWGTRGVGESQYLVPVTLSFPDGGQSVFTLVIAPTASGPKVVDELPGSVAAGE